MKLMVNTATGAIHAASDSGGWQVPDFCHVEEVAGSAEGYAWPHANGAAGCKLSGGAIVANAAVPVSRDVSKLEAIDIASIRPLREFIATLPNAPKEIKDREKEAQDERAKGKK